MDAQPRLPVKTITIILAIVTLLAAGCRSAPQPPPVTHPLPMPMLGAGDKYAIVLFHSPLPTP